MKTLSKLSFAVLLSVCSIASFAQIKDTRQKLYAAFPQTINVDKSTFTNVLQTTVGGSVSLSLTNDFIFRGTVIGNFTKYNNLQTVIVQSTENKQSIFQISKIEQENNVTYTGRILNDGAADGYEIKNNNGTYFLQKFETLQLLDPCKL